jgi:hypothetical protein
MRCRACGAAIDVPRNKNLDETALLSPTLEEADAVVGASRASAPTLAAPPASEPVDASDTSDFSNASDETAVIDFDDDDVDVDVAKSDVAKHDSMEGHAREKKPGKSRRSAVPSGSTKSGARARAGTRSTSGGSVARKTAATAERDSEAGSGARTPSTTGLIAVGLIALVAVGAGLYFADPFHWFGKSDSAISDSKPSNASEKAVAGANDDDDEDADADADASTLAAEDDDSDAADDSEAGDGETLVEPVKSALSSVASGKSAKAPDDALKLAPPATNFLAQIDFAAAEDIVRIINEMGTPMQLSSPAKAIDGMELKKVHVFASLPPTVEGLMALPQIAEEIGRQVPDFVTFVAEGVFDVAKLRERPDFKELLRDGKSIGAGVPTYEIIEPSFDSEEPRVVAHGMLLGDRYYVAGATPTQLENAIESSSVREAALRSNADFRALTKSFSSNEAIWIALDLSEEHAKGIAEQASAVPQVQGLLTQFQIERFPLIEGLLVGLAADGPDGLALRVALRPKAKEDDAALRKLIQGAVLMARQAGMPLVDKARLSPPGQDLELRLAVKSAELQAIVQQMMPAPIEGDADGDAFSSEFSDVIEGDVGDGDAESVDGSELDADGSSDAEPSDGGDADAKSTEAEDEDSLEGRNPLDDDSKPATKPVKPSAKPAAKPRASF